MAEFKTAGIVCEFNPFHKGHEYLIRKTRETLGNDTVIVCVMSGDFVQRGEAAVFSKYARAEAACRSGADLVAELPLPWSCASAEHFAMGALSVLNGLQVRTLSFGSECGDVERLSELAGLVSDESFTEQVRQRMHSTPELSFAAAREQLAEELMPGSGELLSRPNNILGIEYLKAAKMLGCDMNAVSFARFGAEHDSSGGTQTRSASEIRRMLLSGEDASPWVSDAMQEIIIRETGAGKGPVSSADLEAAMLSRLRMLSRSDFEALPDGDNGAGIRLYHAVREAGSLQEIYDAAKTRRLPEARIRRMTVSAVLGIRKDDLAVLPAYARILSATAKGCRYLGTLSPENFSVLSKPAHAKKLPQNQQQIFRLNADAHDLYVLACDHPSDRKTGEDWKMSPRIV